MSIIRLTRDKLDEQAAILFKQVGYKESDKDRTIQRAGLFLKGLRENYYCKMGALTPSGAGMADTFITQNDYIEKTGKAAGSLIDISFGDGSEMKYFSCLTNKYFKNSTPPDDISEEISTYIRFLFTNIENKSAMDTTQIVRMLGSPNTTHPFTYALIYSLFDVPNLTFRPRLNIAMCLSSNIQNQIVAKTNGMALDIDSTLDFNIFINQLLQFIYIVTIPVIPSTITITEVVCIGLGRLGYYALFLVNMTQEMKQTALRKLADYIGQNSDMELFNRSNLNSYIDKNIDAYKTKMDTLVNAYKKANPVAPGTLTPPLGLASLLPGGTLTLIKPSDINYLFLDKSSGTPMTLSPAHLTASIKYCVTIDCRKAHPLYKHIYLYRAYKNDVAHIDADGVRELARLIPFNNTKYIDEVKDLLTKVTDSRKRIIDTIDIPMLDSARQDDDVKFTYKETMQLLLQSLIPTKSDKKNWFDDHLNDANDNTAMEGRDIYIKDGKEFYKDNKDEVEINASYYGKLVRDHTMTDMDNNYCPIAGLTPELTGETCDTLIRQCMLGDPKSLSQCKSVLVDGNFWKKVKDDLVKIVPSDAKKILDTCNFKFDKNKYETADSWLNHIGTTSTEITATEVDTIKKNTRLVQYLNVLVRVVNNDLDKKKKEKNKSSVSNESFGRLAIRTYSPLLLMSGGNVSPITDIIRDMRGGNVFSGSNDIKSIITGMVKGTLKYNPVSPLYKRDIDRLIADYENASGHTFPSDSRDDINKTLDRMHSYETNLKKLQFGLQQYIFKYKTDSDTKPITNIDDIMDMGIKYKNRQDKISATEEKLVKLIKALQEALKPGLAMTLPGLFGPLF